MNMAAVDSDVRIQRWMARIGSVSRRLPQYVLPTLWTLFSIFCIMWLIFTSFKTNYELITNVWAPPASIQFKNYAWAWNVSKLGIQFRNSVIVVSVSVFLLLLVSAPAAYVLSRMPFKGSNLLIGAFVAGAGVPLPLLFIPLFRLMTNLEIINTLPGLIIVYLAVSIPFTMFLLTGFFRSLPLELEEAARLDGASEFAIFRHVMLPLASPGIITVAIFNSIALWNEYMLALVFIHDFNKMPLSRGLYGLVESMQHTGNWVGLFAGVTIVMLPTIVVFFILSERLIEGICTGALK